LVRQDSDMTDTVPTIEVRYSSSKLWRTAGLVAIPGIVCAFLAFGPYYASSRVVTLGFGAAFCGALSIYFLYLAIAKSGRVAFTFGSNGILDERISKEVIPWSSVEAISTWRDPSLPRESNNEDRVVLLKLKPLQATRLNITRTARLARVADGTATGSDGFQIRTGGTDVDYRRLLEVSDFYLALTKLAVRDTISSSEDGGF
jgi:hypothetical protein